MNKRKIQEKLLLIEIYVIVKMVIFGHYLQQFTANTSALKTTQAK